MTTTTATITFAPTAHVSTSHFASKLSSFELKQKRRTFSSGVRCALSAQETGQSRRVVTLSLVFLQFLPKDALGVSLDKYMKKKKLDPLEAYIPALLLTGLQIRELGQSLKGDQPKFSDCRSLLRSGPASSFRINIRAVAQYASDAGKGKLASSEVDKCLGAIEELDSLLLQASRNGSDAPIESMKLKVGVALDALDSILKTVPSDVLDKGKAMADAYLIPDEYLVPEKNDPQLEQLESILQLEATL